MKTLYLLVFLAISNASTAQQLWGGLKPGKYAVGFKVAREHDAARANRPMLVSVWYPAANSPSAKQVLFKDYLSARVINESFSEPSENEKSLAYNNFYKTFERGPFPGDVVKIPSHKWNALLEMPVAAKWDLDETRGKFPTVVMNADPASLSVTAEYLASNGFVVAAIFGPWEDPEPPDSLRGIQQTEDLEWLLDHVSKFRNVDVRKIGALGFGGGIQPAFFLTMSTNRLKSLVNLEGGVFSPRSETTSSVMYHPETMNTPMLHIVTPSQQKEDDQNQVKSLTNTKLYKAFIVSNNLYHHDFSIWGRVYNMGLSMRGVYSDVADRTYTGIHELILEFLELVSKNKVDSLIVDQQYAPLISLQ